MKSRSLRKEIVYLHIKKVVNLFLVALPVVLLIVLLLKPEFYNIKKLNFYMIFLLIIINTIINIYFYNNVKIKLYGIKGEYKVYKQLKVIKKMGYKLFQNVHLKNNDIKAQLDFIIVGINGIFIVEVKNQRGVIIGNCESKYLTKIKKSKSGNEYKKKIYNPIKQVNTHIYKLSKILRNNGINSWIEGIVLFSNKDSNVKINSDKILIIQSENCDELIKFIKKNDKNVLSKSSIEKIVDIINDSII